METVQIFVQGIGGQVITFAFDRLLTLVDLHASIKTEAKVGLDVDISLIFEKQILPRRSELSALDYLIAFGIENGSVLTMVKRPCPRLLTTSWDETAKVWDPETGECLLTLFPHDAISTRQDYGRLNDAFFSSDGSTIVTLSDEKLQ